MALGFIKDSDPAGAPTSNNPLLRTFLSCLDTDFEVVEFAWPEAARRMRQRVQRGLSC